MPGNKGVGTSRESDTVSLLVPDACGTAVPVVPSSVPDTSTSGETSAMDQHTASVAGAVPPLVPNMENDPPIQRSFRRQVLVMPYVPGIGQKLQNIARKYDFETWFTFPGKISQLFTRHRGREHPSKSQNSIYCAQCTYGIQYIGESSRNLKVQLNEHHFGSSISLTSIHMHNTGHKPTMHDTVILGKERNCLK